MNVWNASSASSIFAGGIMIGTIALCFAINAVNSFWASVSAYALMLASLWIAAVAGHMWLR